MTQQLLSELARAKALFQARAVALHLGATPPQTLTPKKPLTNTLKDEDR